MNRLKQLFFILILCNCNLALSQTNKNKVSIALRSIGVTIFGPANFSSSSTSKEIRGESLRATPGFSFQYERLLDKGYNIQIDLNSHKKIIYKVPNYLLYEREINSIGLNIISEKQYYILGVGIGVLWHKEKLQEIENPNATITHTIKNGISTSGFLKFIAGAKYQFKNNFSLFFTLAITNWLRKEGAIKIHDNGENYNMSFLPVQVGFFSNLGVSYSF